GPGAGPAATAGMAPRGAAPGGAHRAAAAARAGHERDQELVPDHGHRAGRAVLCRAPGGDRDVPHLPGLRHRHAALYRRHCGARGGGAGAAPPFPPSPPSPRGNALMDFGVIADILGYFMVGPWPDGPLGGAALTLVLSVASALISALLGLVGGIALSLLQGPAQTALRLVLGFFRAIPVIMLIFWIY